MERKAEVNRIIMMRKVNYSEQKGSVHAIVNSVKRRGFSRIRKAESEQKQNQIRTFWWKRRKVCDYHERRSNLLNLYWEGSQYGAHGAPYFEKEMVRTDASWCEQWFLT